MHGMQGVSGSNPLGSTCETPSDGRGFWFLGFNCYPLNLLVGVISGVKIGHLFALLVNTADGADSGCGH